MFDNLVILSMNENLFLLAAYVLTILSALCIGAFIGDKIMDWQDAALKYCFYGYVKAGACLKPRVKKSKFNVIVRAVIARLRFN